MGEETNKSVSGGKYPNGVWELKMFSRKPHPLFDRITRGFTDIPLHGAARLVTVFVWLGHLPRLHGRNGRVQLTERSIDSPVDWVKRFTDTCPW